MQQRIKNDMHTVPDAIHCPEISVETDGTASL
jgi:hypothetical protein